MSSGRHSPEAARHAAVLAIVLQAFVLGLGAGLAPGPLLALVMSESLRGGARAGMRVAVAPLITDTPVVALSWALVGSLNPDSPWLAALSLGGALVVAHLAVEQWRATLPEPGVVTGTESLLRGAAVNLLSPYPWLFWITLGGPLLAGAADESVWRAVAFLTVFYLLLVGTKIVLALLTGRWGRGLTDAGYRRVCRVLGLALLVFATQLAWDGFERLTGGLTPNPTHGALLPRWLAAAIAAHETQGDHDALDATQDADAGAGGGAARP